MQIRSYIDEAQSRSKGSPGPGAYDVDSAFK
jgi:hypothetical protein